MGFAGSVSAEQRGRKSRTGGAADGASAGQHRHDRQQESLRSREGCGGDPGSGRKFARVSTSAQHDPGRHGHYRQQSHGDFAGRQRARRSAGDGGSTGCAHATESGRHRRRLSLDRDRRQARGFQQRFVARRSPAGLFSQGRLRSAGRSTENLGAGPNQSARSSRASSSGGAQLAATSAHSDAGESKRGARLVSGAEFDGGAV